MLLLPDVSIEIRLFLCCRIIELVTKTTGGTKTECVSRLTIRDPFYILYDNYTGFSVRMFIGFSDYLQHTRRID